MMETHQDSLKSFIPSRLDFEWVFKNLIAIKESLSCYVPIYLDDFETFTHDEIVSCLTIVGVSSQVKNMKVIRAEPSISEVDYYFDFIFSREDFPQGLYSSEIICFLRESNIYSFSGCISEFKVGSIILQENNYGFIRTVTEDWRTEF
jgi:hypothetical protein